MNTGRNQGGIKRGDRADTGDLEARPTDSVAQTGGNDDLEDLSILDAGDPELGLTGIGGVPAEDWAANTGPTRTGEASSHGVDSRLEEDGRAPGGRKIEFDHEHQK